ncbi:hypothetical protein HDV03_003799 [Kappamyces sp. JEL0829]|nr:hypothetical protein HDV03_003799 [Kappamyces sp. JEL0829]
MSCPNVLNAGRMEAAIGAALATGILTVQTIHIAMDMNTSKIRMAMLLQFVLITIRQITVTVAAAAPAQDCYATTVIGLLVYHCWVVLLEYVIYYRTQAFIITTFYNNLFTGLCLASFAAQLAVRFYQIASVVVLSSQYCSYVLSGASVSTTNYALLTGTLLVMILPFFYNMYIVFSRELVNRSIFPAYNGLMFSIINTFEANVVLLMMDDFRKAMTSHPQSIQMGHPG